MTLQTIISWLREVEGLACSVYSAAADCETVSEEIRRVLKQLAEDEMWNYHLMGSAADLFREQETSPVTVIVIDSATRDRTETPLKELLQKIEEQQVAETDILQTIHTLEASRWHDLLLYVMNCCSEASSHFQKMPGEIQAQGERIKQFLETSSTEELVKNEAGRIADTDKASLLVFEADPIISKLFERLLSDYGAPTIVRNEEEAMAAIEKQPFKVIMVDVDTPEFDGLAFVRHAIEKHEELRPQVILQTAKPTSEIVNTANKYNMPILGKPYAIHELLSTVERTVNPETAP